MEFKKRKEKENYINVNILDKYSNAEITIFLQSYYKSGDIIDQSVAYIDCDAATSNEIRDNVVTISRANNDIKHTNIAIGGCGVWNSGNSRKLAKIVKRK